MPENKNIEIKLKILKTGPKDKRYLKSSPTSKKIKKQFKKIMHLVKKPLKKNWLIR
jgi:hypothetical protein